MAAWLRAVSGCLSLAAVLAAPLRAVRAESSQWDLSWVAGVEYTPAAAPGNSLWWWRYDDFAADVDRELAAAARHFGFNHLRMFLHPLVYDGPNGTDRGQVMFRAMARFLDTAEKHGFRTSFVFFDGCWNHTGADLHVPCVPTKGRHNGCWFASPQDVQRTNVSRFKRYVVDTITKFAQDARVPFWEIYNEPEQEPFSMQLRSAAFAWAVKTLRKAGHGRQAVPVLSCWDDNNSTQVVDMHRYDSNFTAWTSQVFQNPSKGALITEGGSRWYQSDPSDSGSPLTVLRWFHALRSMPVSREAPFKFGMVTNWELMVGGSNTRWHWNTKDRSPEPVIPWDGYMLPDGSPVSYTEAAAVRNWTLGRDDFLAFDDFLPSSADFVEDSFLCLQPGSSYAPSLKQGVDGSMVLAETTVWLNASTGGGLVVRSQPAASSKAISGYFAGWHAGGTDALPQLVLERWSAGKVKQLASFDMGSLDCGFTMDGWNMLRVIAEGPVIHVYANPMQPEAAAPGGIMPRIAWTDATWLTGGVALVATGAASSGACTRFDYIGVLDPMVSMHGTSTSEAVQVVV